MRISSREVQQVGLTSILDQQDKLTKTQLQVSSGKRVLTPSDDPVATTQILKLHQSMDTTQRHQDNAGAATDRLNTEEGVLQGVTNLLQRVRELAVQGNNATQSNETRQFIASELRQRLEELVGLANTKDGAGDYLFSGGKGATEPFVPDGAGGYNYEGDQNQRFLQIGSGRQVADGDPGSTVFQLIRNGNGTFVADANSSNTGSGVIDAGSVNGTYTPSNVGGVSGYTLRFIQAAPTDPITYEVFATGDPQPTPHPSPVTTGTYVAGQPIEFNGARVSVTGTPADGDTFTVKSSDYQNIFQTLENLASALETPVSTQAQHAQLNNDMNRGLADIDQALGNILVVRSSVGSRLNAIDSQKYVNDGYMLQTKQVLSSTEDLDYAEAITRLNLQMTGLSAAQKAYMKVQGLSMFDYLSL